MALPSDLSITNMYVIHKSFQKYNPEKYTALENEYQQEKNKKSDNNFFQVSKTLIDMAEREREKEMAFLQQRPMYNKLKVNLNNNNSIRAFIKAFNTILAFKPAFERNISRIQANQQHIDISSLFDEYFATSWKDQQSILIENIKKGILNQNSEELINIEYIKQKIKESLTIVVKQTWKKMFDSADFQNSDDHSLLELKELFTTFKAQGDLLVQRMVESFNLEETLKNFETLSGNKQTLSDSDINGMIKINITGRRGLALEALENAVINAFKQVDGFTAIHSGSLLMKADNIIISANISPDAVEKALKELKGQQVKRATFVNAIKNFQKELQGVSPDDFIIYSSAKNYLQRGSFEGFSAGAPVSVKSMNEVMLLDGRKNLALALQTAKGAIGENDREEIKTIILQDLAYYLFDDFDTIGVGLTANSATTLHIFNLDGIYVPLSVLLYKLGRAVSSVQQSPSSFVSAKISAPNILENASWEEQRESAMNETKISMHFAKDFFDMIKKF